MTGQVKAIYLQGRFKGIFVQTKDGMGLEEVLEIAKSEAQRIGMGDRSLLKCLDVRYSKRLGGFFVAVQNFAVTIRPFEARP
jgi:hypothetical protein